MLDQAAEYEENVGHPPRQAPEEYAWQWRYHGLPRERDLLLDLLQDEAEDEVEQFRLFEEQLSG